MIGAYIALFILVIVIIFALFYAFVVIQKHRERVQEIKWLRQIGTQVNATVTRIDERQEMQMEKTRDFWIWNESTHKWERNAGTMEQEEKWRETWPTRYYILAQWSDPQTNETYTFESSRLYTRPKQYPPGSVVSVFIAPDDPTRYYMNL